MNLEVIAQLTALALIVGSGPLVIALLAARKGNLWFKKAISGKLILKKRYFIIPEMEFKLKNIKNKKI